MANGGEYRAWQTVRMEQKSEHEPSMFISDDTHSSMKENEESSELFRLFEKREKSTTTDLDLQLAAEIGKSLLERNRELELLLRTSQECTEEQTLRAQFFEQQTELLRESLENQTKISEQIESQNHELQDKYLQLQTDNKTLNSRNKRFWDTIESLEKKCEHYRYQVEMLEEENLKQFSFEQPRKEESYQPISDKAETNECQEDLDASFNVEMLQERIESLQTIVKEFRIQQNIDNLEKEELKAELEDISTDNQLLQHQATMLESEIEEWKNVCQKAQKYKQLADKYSSQFDVFPNSDEQKKTQYRHLKSSSHEVLNNAPLCGATELLATRQKYLSSSVSQLNHPPKHLSVLSEMDHQYHDLVKKYENLLDKYHGDEKTINGHERARKVQRAIQTLSWDFASVGMQTSPKKEKKEFVEPCCAHCPEEPDLETNLDFRKMFVEIFAKLRESKEFDPWIPKKCIE